MSDSRSGDETPELDAGGPVEMHSPHHAARHHRVSGRLRRRLVVVLLVLLGAGGAAAGVGVLTGFLPNPVVAGDPKADGRNDSRDIGPMTVKVIQPKRDPAFRITVRNFATVEPYYQAGLRARVSGVVRFVTKDIGEPVRAGELLVDIDVPDLRQAVEQKAALIVQRERELDAATADLAVARSAVDGAAVAVRLKGVEVNRMKDLQAARKTELDQWIVLFKGDAAVKARVDAASLDHQAAIRAVETAEAEVEKAKVEQSGKAASLEKATADVELKRAMVEVARRDRDAAAIQAGYARLYAPFDGVITARATDPGKFVFSSASGSTEPLVTVARTDLVTVVTKIADNAAPFVSWDTEATVEFAQPPGLQVRGPITRFSNTVDPADQTMRVEVDVYNGTQAEYRAMLTRSAMKTTIAPLVPDPAAALLAACTGMIHDKADHKGWHEGHALTPDWGAGGRYRRIVAGTTATMRLDLEKFSEAVLLPSGAIYGRAGQQYILVVEDGVTRAIPVVVQVNDGTLVKAAMRIPTSDGRTTTRELTGDEMIVSTRQLEVGEGRKVKTVREKW